MLSIVPFLAVAFSLAKGLGLYDSPPVRDWLLRLTAGRAEVVDQILAYIQQTNVRTLGAVGTLLLLATAVSLVSTIEGAVNAAWGITAQRDLRSRFTNYLVLTVVCPPLLFAAVSAMASLRALEITRRLLEIALVGEASRLLLAVAPALVIWAAFYLLYQFLPNTRVRPSRALLGALVAGSLWQLVQWAYLNFQFGAKDYNAIYGSFAQIPLLLLWLYVSWVIVLLGAQVSHTAQCYAAFVRRARAEALSQTGRQALALFLLLAAARAAASRRLPPDADRLAEALGLDGEPIAALGQALAAAGLAVPAASAGAPTFVVLARPDGVTVADVVRAVDDGQTDALPESTVAAFPVLAGLVEAVRATDRGQTLEALLGRFGPDLDAALLRLE